MKRLLWLFPLLALLASPAFAATYYADDGGSGTTCADALNIATPLNSARTAIRDCATSGDTVYVRAGTYNERLTINDSGITVQAYPGDAEVRIRPANSDFPPVLFDQVQNVTFDGFVIDGIQSGYVGGWHDGINMQFASDNIIRNVQVVDTFSNCIFIDIGSHRNRFTNVSMTNCGVRDTGYAPGHNAVYGSGDDNIVEDSFVDTAQGGIMCWSSESDPADRCIFRRNHVKNVGTVGTNHQIGIGCAHGNGCQIHDNVIHHNNVGIYILLAHFNAIVYNNTVADNVGSFGIGVSADSTGARIVGNIVRNNAGTAIAHSNATLVLNFTNDPLFIDAVGGNYGLQAASAAIGTSTSAIATGITRTCNGSCEPGAFEIYGPTTTGGVVNGANWDIDFTALRLPMTPATACQTGFTLQKDTAGNGTFVTQTINSCNRTADARFRFVTASAVGGSDQVRYSYATTGSINDSAIGEGTGSGLSQRLNAVTNQALVNQTTGGATPLSQCAARWGKADVAMGHASGWIFDSPESGPAKAAAGGKVRFHTAICNASGGASPQQAYALFCSLNGGAFTRVTSATGATLKIAYHTNDQGVQQGQALTEILQTTGQTFEAGGGWSTGTTTPAFVISNNRQVQRGHSLLLASTFAIATDTLTCREYLDDGTALSGSYVDSTLTGRAPIAFSK